MSEHAADKKKGGARAGAAASPPPPLVLAPDGMTVFGLRTIGNASAIDDRLRILYGQPGAQLSAAAGSGFARRRSMQKEEQKAILEGLGWDLADSCASTPDLSPAATPQESVGMFSATFQANVTGVGGEATDAVSGEGEEGEAARKLRCNSPLTSRAFETASVLLKIRGSTEALGIDSPFLQPTDGEGNGTAGAGPSMASARWKKASLGVFLMRQFRKLGYPWVQLAGHSDGFKKTSGDKYILKLSDPTEKAALQTIITDDHLRPFVAEYAGPKMVENKEYLQLENLLNGYIKPCVMDCKLGVRTFLETPKNKKPRMDLLAKMMKIDPDEPTEEEALIGITKMRYMSFREKRSTTQSLGFRIEAIKQGKELTKDFQNNSDPAFVQEKFKDFLSSNPAVLVPFLRRLRALRAALVQSAFFKHHEIVGSSLLFVYDQSGKGNIHIIDFGKTTPRDVEIKHDVPWEAGTGSYEDGYLIGLSSVEDMLMKVALDLDVDLAPLDEPQPTLKLNGHAPLPGGEDGENTAPNGCAAASTGSSA